MENRYKKSKGNAGLEGVQFQLDLLIVSLLNAFHSHKNWKISSENQDAGKYDDLVVEFPDKDVLLQAKFKQTKKINKDQLFSCNSKNIDFSLPKYFLSYLEIKSKFKKKTVIICTNTGMDEKGLEKFLIRHCVDSNSTLHYEGATCIFFTFNKSIIPDLKTCAMHYLDTNLKGKGVDRAEITDRNIIEFLENLQIFTRYPNGEKLHKIIDRLLSRLNVSNLWHDTSYHEIYRKVEDWFQQPKGEYLTEIRTKAMLCEIKSDKYCESLRNYNVCFKYNDLDLTNSKIFHVKTHGGGLLQMLNIFRAFEGDKCRKLYVNPDESEQVQEQIVEAFQLPQYVYLVMIWNRIKNESIRREMCRKFKEIVKKDPYKKVILVVKGDSEAQSMGLADISKVERTETFEDLSQRSQKMLLKNKNIVFQGKYTSLNELLPQTSRNYSTSFDCVMLEELIKGEKIKVGMRPLKLDEGTTCYYINRKFERDIDKPRQSEAFTEESIFDVTEKVIVISDSAGMGKSTVLTDMAVCIKQKYPWYWVIRANLNDYTRILRDSVRKNRQSIGVVDLLNSRETTKLSNNFEKFVFSMKGKVVLMLDGVDEISPDYTRLILNLLKECRKAPNVKKIFVTTRFHMARELKAALKVDIFKMLPFSRSNQIDFLTRYWSYNLHLDCTADDRIQLYAENLIKQISLWVQLYRYKKKSPENSFVEIPLQLKMLAEIFLERCKQYLDDDKIGPKLLQDVNIVNLYEMCIDKKREVFLDKGNPSGNTTAKQALANQFEEGLAWHRNLAAQIIMNNKADFSASCHVSSKDMENLILKIGIVQRLGDDFQFVHKTFAEYFTAQYIVKQLQLKKLHVNFQKSLIDVILQDIKYGIVCDFLDSLLQKVVHTLPSNIFEGYYTSTSDTCDRGSLIFELSKGGWVSILRLVLKSVNFKIITDKRISVKHLKRKKRMNTLNDLQFLVQKSGVNITDESGDTPLHSATDNAHLTMVKFLIEQGADVNIRNLQGDTALHTATVFNFIEIVHCLVEYVNTRSENENTNIAPLVADLNIRNNQGETALYIAAESGFLNIVKYLVQQGADVTISDNTGRTPLHVAAYEGHLDTVLYLAGHGVGLNIKDNKGRTPLHIAVNSCRVDAVEHLVAHAAKVNVRDNRGRTPLHIAADQSKMNVVDYLLGCGADCNVKDKHGHTALHLAALGGIIKSRVELNDVMGSDESIHIQSTSDGC